MRPEFSALNVPTPINTAGTAARVDRFREKTVQFIQGAGGVYAGTLDLEGSLDGNAWSPLVQGITAPAIVFVTASVFAIRVKTGATNTNPMTAIWGGFDSRTDGG